MKYGKVFSKGSLVLALSLTAILFVTACAPSGSTVVQALEPVGPAPGAAPSGWDTNFSQEVGVTLTG